MTGLIDVIDANSDGWDAVKPALASGKGAVFYVANYRTVKAQMAEHFPEADIWYCERNGDPIGVLVPKGTSQDRLPNAAKGYLIREWEDPDA